MANLFTETYSNRTTAELLHTLNNIIYDTTKVGKMETEAIKEILKSRELDNAEKQEFDKISSSQNELNQNGIVLQPVTQPPKEQRYSHPQNGTKIENLTNPKEQNNYFSIGIALVFIGVASIIASKNIVFTKTLRGTSIYNPNITLIDSDKNNLLLYLGLGCLIVGGVLIAKYNSFIKN